MNKFIFILVISSLFVSKSLACDCLGPSSDIDENWRYADQIFIGEVVASTSNVLYTGSGLNFTFYTIQVEEPIKGSFHPKYRLRTFEKVGNGSCEYYFEVGKKYLIYANEISHILRSDICDRTAPLEEVNIGEIEELKRLTKYHGEIKNPILTNIEGKEERELEAANAKIEELNNTRKWLLGISLALAFLLILSVITVLSRKKGEVQQG